MSDPSNSETDKIGGVLVSKQEGVVDSRRRLSQITQEMLPKYDATWPYHVMATLPASSLARMLYVNELYQKIIDVPGVICEFGVQWGSTLGQLVALRSIYEPFNVSRTIVGFDTFEGFLSTRDEDGALAEAGDYSTGASHKDVIEEVLSLSESMSPMPHVKKHELVKGDASVTIETWLEDNPHALISMAIFDMDLYEPTKNVLPKILPRLTKGSLLVFDELNCKAFPGETTALNEVLGANNLRLYRTPLQPYCSWCVWGD